MDLICLLIFRLMARDPEKYRCPVPCNYINYINYIIELFCPILFSTVTTRIMRSDEIPGREYLFVSREKMETDVAAGKFIEHGEFRGHLYGTSAESVKSIINAGSVCIMNPHYQAIKALRTPQLKPYIIHIKPPLFDDLKITRSTAKAVSSHDETSSRGFTVNTILLLD